jgi:hypothetical protein
LRGHDGGRREQRDEHGDGEADGHRADSIEGLAGCQRAARG